MTEAVCKHCGKSEDEHCFKFEMQMPAGCQCSPGEWGQDVKAICHAFVGENRNAYCKRCEHDFACHQSAPTLNGG